MRPSRFEGMLSTAAGDQETEVGIESEDESRGSDSISYVDSLINMTKAKLNEFCSEKGLAGSGTNTVLAIRLFHLIPKAAE